MKQAVAVFVVVVVGLAMVAALRSANAEIAELQRRQEASTRDVFSAMARVEATDESLNGLSRRISDLEAARDSVPDAAEVAERVQHSVFTVVTDGGEGSGWVVAPGKVVTNFHVIADGFVNDRMDVTLNQGDRRWAGKVVATSAAYDLAVIAADIDAPVLERAAEQPRIGDPVLAMGSPLGLDGTVSSGIVSAFRTEKGIEYLQFSAAISPGSSGGPVISSTGQVLGVSVAKYVGSGAEGLSFAVPIARLCDALEVC